MAAVTKTSSTLNINLADGADATTTWKIDSPRSDVTLAEVTTALNYLRMYPASGRPGGDDNEAVPIFRNSAGNEILRIKSVEREQIVKTVEQVL